MLSLVPFYLDVGLSLATSEKFAGNSGRVPPWVKLLRLLRLLRILKLLRHYSGWRVLILAIARSWRPIFVPMFAIVVTTLILGGILNFLEEETFPDHLEAMWCVFWLVLTLGYDGDLGSGSLASRILICVALIAGVLFTTMPITIVGNAFAVAWEKKEVIEVALNVQELLIERGLEPRDVEEVFKEFDEDGSGTLDMDEFRHALRVLHNDLPWEGMKRLFKLFDLDESGHVDHAEFCSLIFPDIKANEEREAAKEAGRVLEEGEIEKRRRSIGRRDSEQQAPVGASEEESTKGTSPPGTLLPLPTRCCASTAELVPGSPRKNLVRAARVAAGAVRDHKEPDIRAEIQELRRMQMDTQKMVEDLAAGMKLIHRHLAITPI